MEEGFAKEDERTSGKRAKGKASAENHREAQGPWCNGPRLLQASQLLPDFASKDELGCVLTK